MWLQPAKRSVFDVSLISARRGFQHRAFLMWRNSCMSLGRLHWQQQHNQSVSHPTLSVSAMFTCVAHLHTDLYYLFNDTAILLRIVVHVYGRIARRLGCLNRSRHCRLNAMCYCFELWQGLGTCTRTEGKMSLLSGSVQAECC